VVLQGAGVGGLRIVDQARQPAEVGVEAGGRVVVAGVDGRRSLRELEIVVGRARRALGPGGIGEQGSAKKLPAPRGGLPGSLESAP
jgi:hypothetical protein